MVGNKQKMVDQAKKIGNLGIWGLTLFNEGDTD